MKLRPLLPLIAAVPILVAAPPPRVTSDDLKRHDDLVAPGKIPDLGAKESLKAADLLDEATAARIATFLGSMKQNALISQLDAPAPSAEDDIEKDPLEGLFEPEPDTLLITCNKGIYLDGESYEIVYLGKVKIQGQGMTMTCNEQLKAVFHPPEKEEKKEADPEKEDGPLAKFGGFGDLKQFTSSGDVRVNGKTEDGQKVYLGGDSALYEMSKDGELENSEITFRGKKVAFMLGDLNDKTAKETSFAMTSISDNAWVKAIVRGETLFVEWSKNGWLTKVGLPASDPNKN